MNQCKCGSYAINDDPERERCDVCYAYKQAVDVIESRPLIDIDAIREVVRDIDSERRDMEAIGAKNIPHVLKMWRDGLESALKGGRDE